MNIKWELLSNERAISESQNFPLDYFISCDIGGIKGQD